MTEPEFLTDLEIRRIEGFILTGADFAFKGLEAKKSEGYNEVIELKKKFSRVIHGLQKEYRN